MSAQAMTIDEAVVSPTQENEIWDWRAEDINHEVLELAESNGSAQHQAQLASYRAQLSDPASRVHMVSAMSRGPRFFDILVRP